MFTCAFPVHSHNYMQNDTNIKHLHICAYIPLYFLTINQLIVLCNVVIMKFRITRIKLSRM